MRDRKGNELKPGDRVFVLPGYDGDSASGEGWVRRIKGDRARVDDGQESAGPALDLNGSWSWSSWVNSGEVELLSAVPSSDGAAGKGEGE